MEAIKVLIADGDKRGARRTVEGLSRTGKVFEPIVVKSADAALKVLRAGCIGLVFIDIALDRGCGIELLGQIDRESPGLLVVMTAARGSEALAIASFDRGAGTVLLKNSEYDRLLPQALADALENESRRCDPALHPSNDAERVYDRILSAAADLLSIHSASVMLLDETTGLLETKAARGLSRNFVTMARPAPGESVEGRAILAGAPVISKDLVDESDFAYREIAANEGLNSALSVPFRIESAVAVVNLYSHRRDRFRPADKRIAGHLVDLSGLALETLSLYYREHHIAQTLQRSHFPDIDTRFGDWEVAYRYKVCMEEAMLGGDFYDLFTIPGGRRAIVVADVSGKGIQAASQTAMIKHTIRGYALEDPEPSSVMRRTNEAFFAYADTDHFVTVFFGVIDPKANTLTYCSAGHPPALVFSNRLKQVAPVVDVNLPIGAWDRATTFTSNMVTFSPWDAILVYTDGLTDCRRDGRHDGQLFGENNLANLFLDCVHLGAETAADHLLDRIVKFGRGRIRDDIAFFVIRLLERDRSGPRPDKNFSPTVH